MAIFTPGVAVGQISGRVGGSVFSRNRGGMYIRNGSVPSVVRTDKALLYKAYFTASSQAWTALSEAQQLAWTVFSRTQTQTNRLGRSISLTGQALFIGLSARLLASGDDIVATPPVTSAPSPIVPTSLAVDAGSGDTELVFTESPLEAGIKLWVRGAKVNSGSINNVENLLTTVTITAAAAASPLDLESALIAAFGPIQEGATYILECRTLDTASGLVSGKVFVKTVAINTP